MKIKAERLALWVEYAMQHVQPFIARHRTRRRAQYLKIVQHVGFNTGKAGFCRRRIVCFDTECDVLVLDKPVVAFD